MSDQGNMPTQPKPKQSFGDKMKATWWPDVDTLAKARKATMLGVYAVVITGALTVLLLVLAPEYFGQDAIIYVVIQLAVYAVIGFFIWKNSRIAAVVGLALFAVDKLLQIASGDLRAGAIVVMIALATMYINAVRGTFAQHKLRQSSGAGV